MCQPLAEAIQQVFLGRRAGGIDPARLPAEHVQRSKFRPQSLLGIDMHQHAALGAMLVDMASLDIAGENDLRLAVEHFLSMGVPQGPVIVVFGDQARDGAGGVRLMSLAARRAGVQQADIQHPAHRRRVGGGKVVQHGRRGKALAVDRHAPVVPSRKVSGRWWSSMWTFSGSGRVRVILLAAS